MTTLLIATRNRHKVEEIASFLGTRFRFLSLEDFPEAPKVVEDAPTFAGNAVKKARQLAKWLQTLQSLEYRLPGDKALVLADDSGLEVDVLQGAPGVHSARYAALAAPGSRVVAATANSTDAENNAKLLGLLQSVPEAQRTARFRCALVLVRVKPPQPTIAGQTFEGTCEGRIQSVARGRGGFGYDPLFVPVGHTQSFAELGAETKNQLSHRAQALQKVRRYLDTLGL